MRADKALKDLYVAVDYTTPHHIKALAPSMTSTVTEQTEALRLRTEERLSTGEIAERMNLSRHQVLRRLNAAAKRERLDPAMVAMLAHRGIEDLAGLHSGWLIDKDASGSGQSLYFFLGPDGEKLNFADAILDVMKDIPRLAPLDRPKKRKAGRNYANWIALADLHVGGDYGDPGLEEDYNRCIDDLIQRLPPAEHAVFFELGDLLDANDHKGVTPASGNPCDVKRDDHLVNTRVAIRLCRRTIYRLLETHQTVEAHFIKGNHDRTAYMAVMLALAEHFADNPRAKIVVSDAEFRVVSWGQCAAFPHHGDTLNWSQLKDVWADQFADEWAAARMHRHILTAHYHHDRKKDLVGAVGEQFRTLHRPNGWAKSKGLLSRGSLTAMTVHRDRGEEFRTISNIANRYEGRN